MLCASPQEVQELIFDHVQLLHHLCACVCVCGWVGGWVGEGGCLGCVEGDRCTSFILRLSSSLNCHTERWAVSRGHSSSSTTTSISSTTTTISSRSSGSSSSSSSSSSTSTSSTSSGGAYRTHDLHDHPLYVVGGVRPSPLTLRPAVHFTWVLCAFTVMLIFAA